MNALVIRKDSWHYRYFVFIRHVWGINGESNIRSICPYFQSMFWLTVLSLVVSPFMIFGWLFLKIFRQTYKLLVALGFESLAIFLDEKLPMGELSSKVSDGPGLSTTISFIVGAFGLFLVGGGIYAAFVSLAALAMHATEIPGVLWTFLTWVFAGVFILFAKLGQFLQFFWHGIYSFFTDVEMWYRVGHWALIVVAFAAGSSIFGFLLYLFSRSWLGQKMWGLIEFRLNGFEAAREKAREAKLKRLIEAEKAKADLPPKPPGLAKRVLDRLWSYKYKDNISGAMVVVLGPLGALYEFLLAIKKGVCPMIAFVEPPGAPVVPVVEPTEAEGPPV